MAEIDINDLLKMIGEQQVEIRALRGMLRDLLQKQPVVDAPPPEEPKASE